MMTASTRGSWVCVCERYGEDGMGEDKTEAERLRLKMEAQIEGVGGWGKSMYYSYLC